ncbi:LCP family protein [Paenibacillus sp. YPG26]|uniref:LCP family protein n=1 Tax=Paenibacillus sp. YPG26 TaxID=2878915 RepID=UPI0020406D32|nr:LCP family protein [Paenibacillus sp. YPG26]USB33022.1 LCP family protein [Paenibacillus sp. YPG26]
MNKRKVYMLIAGLLLCTALGGYAFYWSLQPSQHFRPSEIPVLAVPDPDAVAAPDTGGRIPGDVRSGPPAAAASPARSLMGEKPGLAQTNLNILILGIDARGSEDSRTDVMMLARVNVDENRVSLVSIPRDTRVKLPGVGYTKINHAHLLGELRGGNHEGTKASLQAVSNLCGCSIHYYVKTDFEGFEHFIDTLGGLEVTLPAPVKLTYAHLTLPAGEQKLGGDLTLKLVQERHSLAEGDQGRQQNQALVLKSILRTLLQPANLARLPVLIRQVREDMVDTNLTDSDLLSLSLLAKEMKTEDMKYYQIPGHSEKLYDPLVKKELYYWIPDVTLMREMYSMK